MLRVIKVKKTVSIVYNEAQRVPGNC